MSNKFYRKSFLIYLSLILIQSTSGNAKSLDMYDLKQATLIHDVIVIGVVENTKFIEEKYVEKCEYLKVEFAFELYEGQATMYPNWPNDPAITNISEYKSWSKSNSTKNATKNETGACGAIYSIKVIKVLKGKIINKKIDFYSTSNYLSGANYVFFLNDTKVKALPFGPVYPKYVDYFGEYMDKINMSNYLEFIIFNNEILEDSIVVANRMFMPKFDKKINKYGDRYSWKKINDFIMNVIAEGP